MEEIIKKGEVVTILHNNGCKSILVMERARTGSLTLLTGEDARTRRIEYGMMTDALSIVTSGVGRTSTR